MKRIIIVCTLIFIFLSYSIGFTQFDFKNFGSIDDLNLIGHASQLNDTLCLTTSATWQTSAVWYKTKQVVNEGFEVSFQFRIDQLTPYLGYLGADGFAFVIQNDSDIVIGGGGGELGYHDIPNSIAFEFDTWDNNVTGQTQYQDPNDNHISINTNGTEANNIEHRYSLDLESDLPDFSDGQIHEVFIKYQDDSLNLFFDTIKSPVLSAKISIKDSLLLDEGTAWVGFTSSTGLATERHSIISWSYNKHLLGLETDKPEQKLNEFRLNQNYPNPFNPITNIEFRISKSEFVTLRIYNVKGQMAKRLIGQKMNAGVYQYQFDGSGLASGIYYYQLTAGDYRAVKKMILLR